MVAVRNLLMHSFDGSRARLALTLLLLGILAGCATAPAPATQNLRVETDDLGMVADWAIRMGKDHGEENVLVVFDIDNTLLAMEQGLGSDQWYYWQKDLAAEDPCSPQLVSDRFAVQGAMFHASAMRATQADAAKQVRRIQDRGITTIALTSRGSDYRLQTFRELRRQDISFWPTAVPPRRGWSDEFIPEGGERPALYEDGVFLTAGQHKGQMMKALLDRAEQPYPTIIILADDKADNLAAMMETFAGTGTWVHAWRYTAEDANVASFDGDKAAAQWDALRPALESVNRILGPDNYDLPAKGPVAGCAP
jgi:hypothetical protein